MTNLLDYFKYDHLPEDLQKISKCFHEVAHKIMEIEKIELSNDYVIPDAVEQLSYEMNLHLQEGDPRERKKCKYKLACLSAFIRFNEFDEDIKKRGLDQLLEAKDAAVRSMCRVKKKL